MRFLGISRKTEFSPNHVVNDALIFQRTAEALAGLGVQVVALDESAVSEATVSEPFVFSMAQGPAASQILTRLERERGIEIVNSPRAVMNCYRVHMVRELPARGVPFPRSVVVDTSAPEAVLAAFDSAKAWIKRGDVHAVHREDVSLTSNPEERAHLLREFFLRGITEAVVQEHLPGDTAKFYGVRGADFFHWFWLNGGGLSFDQGRLREVAEASAEALGLWVFGGDAIIGTDGSITVIDVNDWPSFARVREAASQKIAQLLYSKGRQHV